MADVVIAKHRDALAAAVGADVVCWDAEALAAHRHDYWFLNVLRAHRGRLTQDPLCVVSPTSVEQIQSVLRYANEQRLPVVPFGAGSGVCGGVQPDAKSIVVDMRRMSSILEINDRALTVRVQAGKMGNVFESELNAAGYSAGHFPQSIDVSTVGGWVSTRAAGQYSTRYGNIEDMLLAFEAVLPDGRVVRTRVGPRSATGPDMRNFFLGSEGTLGVLTEVTLRIFPKPESSVAQAFSFASMHDGLEAIRMFMRAGWRPPVVRLYDAIETGRLFTAASKGDNCLMLLVSDGPPALTQVESQACSSICAAHGGEAIGREPVERWLGERNHVPHFNMFIERGMVLDTIEVAITWDRIDDLYREVIAALQAVPGILVASGHSSHSYAQGTNIYFTFAARPEDESKEESTYLECWKQAMEATLRCGGTISHHHGVGRLRVPWMTRELGVAVDLLRTLKLALDPNGIMNPGVLIPSGR